MEIVTVTFNDGNSIYKILLPDFSLPLDKVSGEISVNLLTQRVSRGAETISEMPVIRGGILLANCQMEFPSRPKDNLWNSESPCYRTIHCIWHP